MMGLKNKEVENTEEKVIKEDTTPVSSSNKNLKIIISCMAIAVVLLVFAVGYIAISKKPATTTSTKTPTSTNTNTTKPATTDSTNVDKAGEVKAGLPNLGDTSKKENTKTLDKVDEFLKDLEGNNQPVNYVIKRINTVTDFINYDKKRALTGNGVELYWLEATYKGRPYKVQVPFQIWKELEPSGITVVDVEVLDLGNGSQMVSYMSVRSDYKAVLERSRK